MGQFSHTWWGQRFIAALEDFTDAGRLGRGRSYAVNDRIRDYTVTDGNVVAKVRGSINPYFGVYKEPLYTTRIMIPAIAPSAWTQIIGKIAERADLVTKLLMGEMPDTIEEAFTATGFHLLPHSERDFLTDCSCPDYYNPCKHIAGVCYVLASALDEDPFLMFELRGLSRDALRTELERTPLGQVLASALQPEETVPESANSYYTQPTGVSLEEEPPVSHKEFWTGRQRLPALPAETAQTNVPALLIKKQGDYPAFWHKDTSFIATMEELYMRVRTKSRQMK